MKYASFSILRDRVIISMPNDREVEELLRGLRENFGIDVEEELRSLCG